MRKMIALLFCIVVATGYTKLLANNGEVLLPEEKEESIFDLLYVNEIVDAVLELNIDEVLESRTVEQYSDAIFKFTSKYGQQQVFSAKVSVRGKFRRRVCEFPPLKLDFKKEELEAAGLKGYDKYKLVTHCLNSEEGQENLIEEYLAYKMYNHLTEYSFRVQLLKVRYVEDSTVQVAEGYALLIEETDEMADRLNGEVIEDVYNLTQDKLEPENARIHALFQYMIGNADWNMRRLHNMKVLKIAGKEPLIAVPYDFDFSGIVQASYAIPNQNVGQRTIKERVYMGPYFKSRAWESTFNYFQSKRARILLSIRRCDYLDKPAQDNMILYINGFFHYINKVNRP